MLPHDRYTIDLNTELDSEAEASFTILAEADLCGDSRRRTELALAQDEPEGAIKAGGVTSCKELLGVGTTALTTEFLGRAKLYIEYTIITYCVAFAAATFDTSRSRVQNLD